MFLLLCFALVCAAGMQARAILNKALNEATVKSVQYHLKTVEGREFWGYYVESSRLLITLMIRKSGKGSYFNVAASWIK
ncbi:MAG: hypothetical protein IPN36_17085 [Bacteroidetes bacterium]|nr:hypothetical protein [Bacteroidota bacterium]